MKLREWKNIELRLKQAGCNFYDTSGAAELLGLKPTMFLSRIKNGDCEARVKTIMEKS